MTRTQRIIDALWLAAIVLLWLIVLAFALAANYVPRPDDTPDWYSLVEEHVP